MMALFPSDRRPAVSMLLLRTCLKVTSGWVLRAALLYLCFFSDMRNKPVEATTVYEAKCYIMYNVRLKLVSSTSSGTIWRSRIKCCSPPLRSTPLRRLLGGTTGSSPGRWMSVAGIDTPQFWEHGFKRNHRTGSVWEKETGASNKKTGRNNNL